MYLVFLYISCYIVNIWIEFLDSVWPKYVPLKVLIFHVKVGTAQHTYSIGGGEICYNRWILNRKTGGF